MKFFFSLLFIFTVIFSYGQSPTNNRFIITAKVDTLLAKRADCFKKNKSSFKYYHIQIYNGQDINKARSIKSMFTEQFPDVTATIEWESPEFKVWIGDYETKLAADQALLKFKPSFPNAFVVNPKK